MVLALLVAAAVASPPPAVEARVVEQVVAVIRNPAGAAPRPVTQTRLEEEARIALVSRGAVEAAFGPLDADALRAALDWLVDETLVSDEAARLRVDEVDRDALAAAVRRFRERFHEDGYRRFLEATELTEEDVSAALARGLRVERYLETRIGRGRPVTEGEVEAAIRAQGIAAPTALERDAIRARLVQDRARAQARELLRELRGRADVRVLDPALRPQGGEGG